ncbi:MAG: hypothetical protein G01um101419_317 [Parcubacteria group bacterium Gr01-1014_19]|nr:MAG: hypothetical protein G01um101419_317 [Parcubacteria group bacterium Gr01-1014_19]
MIYSASRVIKADPQKIWDLLSDLRHFAKNDPFHSDFKFESEQREGVGAKFSVEHNYKPIFPFGSDRVMCTVSAWQPLGEVAINEKNPRHWWMDHSQRFVIEPVEDGVRVSYFISYIGVPWPFSIWVSRLVLKRMNEKLAEVEQDALTNL